MLEEYKECIYCGKLKRASEFSLEHILPEALGGNLCGDIFITTRVCQSCNSTCGLWVDGPFVKNWFSLSLKIVDALKYIDWGKDTILPLMCMGILDGFVAPNGDICDQWVGPCGDAIFHFHKKSDDRYSSFIGGNPIDLKTYPGSAYLFAATNNQAWLQIVVSSFKSHFHNARRISGNVEISDDKKRYAYFHEPNEAERELILQLTKTDFKQYKCKHSIQEGFEERFLAKMALGVGFNLFGSEYLKTKYAQALREALWEKDLNKRPETGVRYMGFFEEPDTVSKKTIPWDGGHTIVFMGAGNFFVMTIVFFAGRMLRVVVSDAPSLWAKNTKIANGIVYLLIPQRGKFVGPIDLMNYMSHQLGHERIPELCEIESLKVDRAKLPPVRL